ncbi:hypothetical protein ANCCAN_27922 [Ancylostoma caninum]|uniref:Uncharacterized protein n=1 Tax=Ancylostoma caninum TaxID=29170 RepID=A0A368F2R3_ANCCA|nr:hypothetical protein ANCCAN_27922 [Ancylostoma caninum]
MHGNEVLRDINTADASDRRWQSSMEQLTKNTDYMAFKGARVTPYQSADVFPSVQATVVRSEKVDLNKRLHQKMGESITFVGIQGGVDPFFFSEQLKQNYPNRRVGDNGNSGYFSST